MAMVDAGCQVNPAFVQRLTMATTLLPALVATALNSVADTFAKEAASQAPWQPDGTDNGGWTVTGYARSSFAAYVPGYFSPVVHSYSTTDKYGKAHFSDESLLRQDFGDPPGVVRAVIARYDHNTYNLQREEMGELAGFGRTPGPPQSFGAYYGVPIEVKVLQDNAQTFWRLVMGDLVIAAKQLFKASGGWIF